MRINSGFIGMDSARLYKSSQSIRQSIESSVSGNTSTGGQLASMFEQFLTEKQTAETENGVNEDSVNEDLAPGSEEEIMRNALEKLSFNTKTKIHDIKTTRSDAASQFQKMHELFIQNLLELLFHHRIKNKPNAEEASLNESEQMGSEAYQLVTTNQYTSTYIEKSEFTSFNATGVVKTDDGREINVNINVEMSSRFVSAYSECLSTISYQCIDPLVINLSDAPASLSDVKYFFDLDADGTKEEISVLKDGSGFLALDKNNDGVINDGSELFGTKSGDGFKDLAAFDEDGNGWIDENDSIFESLKIWTKDMDGNDVLYTLKDKDVGAIFLGNVDTEFSLNSKISGETNGLIRKTGIFLYESGNVGTVQHVDLVS